MRCLDPGKSVLGWGSATLFVGEFPLFHVFYQSQNYKLQIYSNPLF